MIDSTECGVFFAVYQTLTPGKQLKLKPGLKV